MQHANKQKKHAGITNNALTRLLYRAGVKRINGNVYDELRYCMSANVRTFTERLGVLLAHSRRKTITQEDVRSVAEQLGAPLLVGVNPAAPTRIFERKELEHKKTSNGEKTRRFKPGTVAARKIKKYQKNSDNLLIPKLNFKRVVLEKFAESQMEVPRFQKNAILLMQLWAESQIVNLAADANTIAEHCERVTLLQKDIQLVDKLNKRRVC